MARGGGKTEAVAGGRFQAADKAEEVRHGSGRWQGVHHKVGQKILNVPSLATLQSLAPVDKSWCSTQNAPAVRSELEKDFRF